MWNEEDIEKHFSTYFEQADNISNNSQTWYIRVFWGSLISLVVSAGLGCISGILNEKNHAQTILIINVIIIVLIIISVICTIVIHQSKLQKYWYDGRAVAESLKTMSWKYINSASPYDHADIKGANFQFANDLKLILQSHEDIVNEINCLSHVRKDIITDEMQSFRQLNWESKKKIYLEQRIDGQLSWYTSKTRYNTRRKNFWFIFSIIIQIIALGSILYVFSNSNFSADLVGFFSSTSATVASWIQVKRYQELQQSYSTTALELNFIYHEGTQVDNELKFLEFVANAEKAISREHTLWIARRDNTKLENMISQ
ncbi:DUF4231 domain-containing protein [Priestia aryabhattai]|uniref:DUF4231 domain-containing protein n=1 Tax=Priestia aryabhattai TaxID=412384 RepID=UPI001CFEF16A|nr:DUF4231 domain-containing protein [Priestia aryabhattai]